MSRPGHSRKPGEAARAGGASAPPIAVVVSRYNASITGKLLDGATAAYIAAGGDPSDLTILDAPGAFELVALSNTAARTGRFRGIVALGCIIKGDTEHDRFIASAVAHGLTQVTMATGLPVAFGVLTVNTPRQARERAGGVLGNKGAEAMVAVLSTARQIEALGSGGQMRHAPAPSLPDKAARNGQAAPTRAAKRAAKGAR